MARKTLFTLIILIFLMSYFLIDCKENEQNKKKDKKNKKDKKEKKAKKTKKAKNIEKEDNTDIAISVIEWAKKNNIYINNKIVLNRKTHRDKHFYFSADRHILNNTLLFKIPYDMMISQFSLNEIYKDSKYKKFQNLWDKISEIKSEYVKYFSTKQLLYMSIILENAIRKKKGPIYKKFKEYLRMYEQLDMDIFPVFYDQQEKLYLSGSNFGSQLSRAVDSLNEEYYLLSNKLNINIPNQDDFLKARVISLITTVDFNNSNLNYTNGFNDTVIVPFFDCFQKVISEERSNARYEIKGIKNETNNYTNYYLEIYSDDEIFIGGEINLKWRPFPNSELLLYYGIVEEGNPYKSRYYVDIINKRLRKELNISDDARFDNARKNMYEINTEFYAPSVIDTYRNLSLMFDKYKNKEEGPYEMMLDNLKYYEEIYNNPLSDGNINMFINGKEKINDIKLIMHTEKKIIEEKIEYLEKVIRESKQKNYQDNNSQNTGNIKSEKDKKNSESDL